MKEHKLSEFQFSQSYLYFWDHFERSNYFLEQILDTLSEPLEGRLVQFLLSKPIEDGGQYDMIVNLVEKYGVVPRDVFPEVEVTQSSRRLNWILINKLREYAMVLRNEYNKTQQKQKCDMKKLREIKKKQLNEIWRIMVISFGKPPQKAIKWSFKNKDKEYKCLEASNPLDFYNKYVRKFVDVSQQISLINDPRNDYYKLYTVDRLNNIINGSRPNVLYINVPSDKLKEFAINQLREGEPVWFGCDVGKFLYRNDGVMDLNNFDYKLLLGIDFKMNKAERLQYGESLMTHAMVFTAVDIDKQTGKQIKWRVENSWSEKRGHKGYCLMTDEWFDQYNYQLVVPKDKLSKDVLDVLQQKPIHLDPWDPMGSLANLSKL